MCILTPGTAKNNVLVFTFCSFKCIQCCCIRVVVTLTFFVPLKSSIVLNKVFINQSSHYFYFGMLFILAGLILSLCRYRNRRNYKKQKCQNIFIHKTKIEMYFLTGINIVSKNKQWKIIMLSAGYRSAFSSFKKLLSFLSDPIKANFSSTLLFFFKKSFAPSSVYFLSRNK